jgi:hypothetical protein
VEVLVVLWAILVRTFHAAVSSLSPSLWRLLARWSAGQYFTWGGFRKFLGLLSGNRHYSPSFYSVLCTAKEVDIHQHDGLLYTLQQS